MNVKHHQIHHQNKKLYLLGILKLFLPTQLYAWFSGDWVENDGMYIYFFINWPRNNLYISSQQNTKNVWLAWYLGMIIVYLKNLPHGAWHYTSRLDQFHDSFSIINSFLFSLSTFNIDSCWPITHANLTRFLWVYTFSSSIKIKSLKQSLGVNSLQNWKWLSAAQKDQVWGEDML